MEPKTRSLLTARDILEELECVLTCVGIAVSARPLSEYESAGVVTILKWTTDKLNECSQSLGTVIDDARDI